MKQKHSKCIPQAINNHWNDFIYLTFFSICFTIHEWYKFDLWDRRSKRMEIFIDNLKLHETRCWLQQKLLVITYYLLHLNFIASKTTNTWWLLRRDRLGCALSLDFVFFKEGAIHIMLKKNSEPQLEKDLPKTF